MNEPAEMLVAFAERTFKGRLLASSAGEPRFVVIEEGGGAWLLNLSRSGRVERPSAGEPEAAALAAVLEPYRGQAISVYAETSPENIIGKVDGVEGSVLVIGQGGASGRIELAHIFWAALGRAANPAGSLGNYTLS